MAHFLLVFDLDGTLVDSVPDLTNTLNKVLREGGYAPLTRAEVAPMVGDGVPALVARGFAARHSTHATKTPRPQSNAARSVSHAHAHQP